MPAASSAADLEGIAKHRALCENTLFYAIMRVLGRDRAAPQNLLNNRSILRIYYFKIK